MKFQCADGADRCDYPAILTVGESTNEWGELFTAIEDNPIFVQFFLSKADQIRLRNHLNEIIERDH